METSSLAKKTVETVKQDNTADENTGCINFKVHFIQLESYLLTYA